MRFFTSDLHFFHKNIIEYCNRPFGGLHHMHEELVRRWNMLVKNPSDEVFVLGDVAFASPSKVRPFFDRMNGKKYLVRGNHDPNPQQCMKMGFNEILNEKFHFEIKGNRVLMCHYPYIDPRDTRYLDRRPKDEGHWLLHGHVHTHWKISGRQINVGVDVWNYAPVCEEDIARIILSGCPN